MSDVITLMGLTNGDGSLFALAPTGTLILDWVLEKGCCVVCGTYKHYSMHVKKEGALIMKPKKIKPMPLSYPTKSFKPRHFSSLRSNFGLSYHLRKLWSVKRANARAFNCCCMPSTQYLVLDNIEACKHCERSGFKSVHRVHPPYPPAEPLAPSST